MADRILFLISGVVMIGGAYLSMFFGVTGYMAFFLFCIPIMSTVLRPIVSAHGVVNQESKLAFPVKLVSYTMLSYGLLTILLLITDSIFVGSIPLVYLFLSICLYPIVHFTYVVLPKSLTRERGLIVPFYPSGVTLVLGYIFVYMYHTADLSPILILPIIICCITSPFLYKRSFEVMLRQGGSTAYTKKQYLIQLLLVFVIGFIVFVSGYLGMGLSSIEYGLPGL